MERDKSFFSINPWQVIEKFSPANHHLKPTLRLNLYNKKKLKVDL